MLTLAFSAGSCWLVRTRTQKQHTNELLAIPLPPAGTAPPLCVRTLDAAGAPLQRSSRKQAHAAKGARPVRQVARQYARFPVIGLPVALEVTGCYCQGEGTATH